MENWKGITVYGVWLKTPTVGLAIAALREIDWPVLTAAWREAIMTHPHCHTATLAAVEITGEPLTHNPLQT